MPATERMIATLPGVRAAVLARQQVIKGAADALFAAHDRPAGHRIVAKAGPVDAYVWLEGPAAMPLEYGHIRSGAYAKTMGPNQFVKGLHIMGRAARA